MSTIRHRRSERLPLCLVRERTRVPKQDLEMTKCKVSEMCIPLLVLHIAYTYTHTVKEKSIPNALRLWFE